MKDSTPICRHCSSPFTVTGLDQAFLRKLAPEIGGKRFDLPEPTFCPHCRQKRRAAHINEMNLYKRTCGLTGNAIISDKYPSSPYTVYDQEVWYSDKWDPMVFGRTYDFSRVFFEQFRELSCAVPYPNLFTGYQYDENCDYTNYAGKNKNCYLLFDSDEDRDCYYCYSLNGSRDCVDCFRMRQSELCYWCVDSYQCYSSSFLQDCTNCNDCIFCQSCIGCKNCLMCLNMQNKEYMVENQQVSKEAFEQFVASFRSRSAIAAARARFDELKSQYPRKAIHGIQSESVSGDYLTQCKNAYQCFDGVGLWDCAHIYRAFYPLKDSMDCEAPGGDERLYECGCVGYNAQNVFFSGNCLDQVSDLFYCSFCFHTSNCFGCVGLRHKHYCILNRQYAKEEYEALAPRIIAHMQETQEFGEFFPMRLSLFAYNESNAQDYYPLTKEEILSEGCVFRERDPKEYLPQNITIPDAIDDVPDGITKAILACASCRRNYKIIPQELAFYRSKHLPVPDRCFFCRHRARLGLRNPRKLWTRTCAKCGTEIQTTYSPDRPEIVYCEHCYLQTVH